MNLKALQLFSAIMKHGTLAKAADVHCLSESAASRQISVLEAELGFKLFSRERRNLRPTTEGMEFYKEAQRILYGLDDLPEIARAIKRQHGTILRLVSVPRLTRSIVSPAIARMAAEQPDIRIKVDVQAMRYLERWVAGFQFHLGLGRLPAEHPAIVTRKFCSLPTMVLLPNGHRLASRSELTLDDLDDEPLVALLKQTLLQKNIDNIYHNEGKVPRPVVEVSSSYHAASIVASGFGITIGDPFTAHSLGDNAVTLVPLKTDFRYEFAFFEPARGQLSEAAKIFVQHVEQVVAGYLEKYGY